MYLSTAKKFLRAHCVGRLRYGKGRVSGRVGRWVVTLLYWGKVVDRVRVGAPHARTLTVGFTCPARAVCWAKWQHAVLSVPSGGDEFTLVSLEQRWEAHGGELRPRYVVEVAHPGCPYRRVRGWASLQGVAAAAFEGGVANPLLDWIDDNTESVSEKSIFLRRDYGLRSGRKA